jgi:hypothetical protein
MTLDEQAIADQDKNQSFEATDESFEYKNHLDTTGKRFLKVTGQVYARKNQQSAFDPDGLKFFDSMGDDRYLVPSLSSTSVLSKTVSYSETNNRDEDLTKKAMLPATIFQPQTTKMNLNSLNASKNENSLHREKFDSLFHSEKIVKNDQGALGKALVAELAVPKLLLKRKAAWSGVVVNRGPAAANADISEHLDALVAEDGPHQQKAGFTDLHAVRLQFQHQRYVFCSKNSLIHALNLKTAGNLSKKFHNPVTETRHLKFVSKCASSKSQLTGTNSNPIFLSIDFH